VLAGAGERRFVKLTFFVHSTASDWNHGNAHFVRGLMDALVRRGHGAQSWEARGAWSLENLLRDEGIEPVVRFARAYPRLDARTYRLSEDRLRADLERAVAGSDVVVVHEWTEREVVQRLVELASRDRFVFLFHDTHHRAVSMPHAIRRLPLQRFHGVLAFGRSLAALYREEFGVARAWTFHEAADVHRFRPLRRVKEHDVVWIGNWGDEERTAELRDYLLGSARALPDLGFVTHGVRYPDEALREMADAGIEHRGWVPSLDVPEVLARSRAALHVPRRVYRRALPGIPTIRVFEALACGVPLVCSPWDDTEGLFARGDLAVAATPTEMANMLRCLAMDDERASRQAERGLRTIYARHTCDHRALELTDIVECVGRHGSDVRPPREESVCA
jgi:spore maturation protein CgeB